MKSHRDMDVWKCALELSVAVYRGTERFPAEERYGLVSQMRRASVSVISNISEGSARQTKKEYIWYLYCAAGSLAEIEAQMELSKRLDFVSEGDALQIM